MRVTLSIFLSLFFSSFILSQTGTERIGIYIDCQMRCDYTYIKEEIQFVNYMQDRHEADVYILATRQRTGAGGNEIQLVFTGNNAYAEIQDTIIYFVDPDATDAIEREQLVKNLKKGLLPYLLQSPLSNKIDYTIPSNGNNEEENAEESIVDPWNYWIISIGGSGHFEGEESFSGADLTGRFFASRVIDKSKFYYSARYNYEREKFLLSDGEEFVSIKRRYSNRLLYVKSISNHWSAGAIAEAGSSTFGNTDFDAELKPAVEYNVFPYSESST